MKSHCLNCAHLNVFPYQEGYSEDTPSEHAKFYCGAGKWDLDGIRGGREAVRELFAASETCDRFVPDEPSQVFNLDGTKADFLYSPQILVDVFERDFGGPKPCPSWARYVGALKELRDRGEKLTDNQMDDLLSRPVMRPGKPDVHRYRRVGRTSSFAEVPLPH